MRLVQFLQVMLLLALAAYVVLVQLENPTRVQLPGFGGGRWELPLGVVLALALVAGALYACTLLLPLLLGSALRSRREARVKRALEEQLSTTLQAKLAAPTRGAWLDGAPEEPGAPVTVGGREA